jgi:class 3 adenylate cyclase
VRPRKRIASTHMAELRLFLEELVCDLVRFELEELEDPSLARIDREVHLGLRDAFADVRVTAPGQPTRWFEIKFGQRDSAVLERVRHKYSVDTPLSSGPGRLVLVVDTASRPGWEHLKAEVARSLRPGLELEVWDEARLDALVKTHFGVGLSTIDVDPLLGVRHAVETRKGFLAFGDGAIEDYENTPLAAQLLWHFGPRRLRDIAEGAEDPREILPPRMYRSVVVLVADLCSFSSFVRDTRDDAVVRESLTAFYSRARHQIHEAGGMLYETSGDYVVGLFGVPDQPEDYVQRALEVALALISIGTSVSRGWQRQIDRDQVAGGVHVALALGDLQIFSLRPFSRTHVGAVGDALNVAQELVTAAKPSEIVITNPLHRMLDVEQQTGFADAGTTETRRLGQLKHWTRTIDLPVHEPGDEHPTLMSLDPVRMLSAEYSDIVRLGQGGMGLVMRATSRKDGSVVAVKVLSPALASDPILVKRFMREVKALTLLDHPSIVRVVSSHPHPLPHYVMEYVPWADLRARMKSGPLPLASALHIAAQVALALAGAHGRGVVHRDVKPANVLVGPENRVKLVDFGIASVAGETGVTHTGQFMGTPRYMSPEQVDGGVVTSASDIYSLALMLFEMVAGESAFEDADLRSRVRRAPVPLPAHPQLGTELAALIDRCLGPVALQRPAASEVGATLASLMDRLPG